MNKLETKYQREAMQVSLEWHLVELPEDMSPMDVYNNLGRLLDENEYCMVWEPLEDWSLDALKDSIWNLKAQVLATMVSMASYVDNGMKD
jgi:hypothetical protein